MVFESLKIFLRSPPVTLPSLVSSRTPTLLCHADVLLYRHVFIPKDGKWGSSGQRLYVSRWTIMGWEKPGRRQTGILEARMNIIVNVM